MKPLKLLSQKSPMKPSKIFNAQVNCTCKKDCAKRVDVVMQKEIFDKYNHLRNWSKKTIFLRSLVKRCSTKENLNPRQCLKKKEYHSSYYLRDEIGNEQKVCSTFLKTLFQINRVKVFRAVSSASSNPNAEDRRGKFHKEKTDPKDISFAREFIKTLPVFESKINSQSSDVKYFHPKLNLKIIYNQYQDKCKFRDRVILSFNIFDKILKTDFRNIKPFKRSNEHCEKCYEIKRRNKPKVISEQMRETIQLEENAHLTIVRETKNKFLQSIEEAKTDQVEVITFELQPALEIRH